MNESILFEPWGISGLEVTRVASVTDQSGGFETFQWKEYWNKEPERCPHIQPVQIHKDLWKIKKVS